MKRFFMFCLIGMVALLAVAQTSYRQRQLTMDGGLPTNTVNSIVQDSRGFMWYGTASGLCRFDGVSVVSYRNTSAQSAATVTDLLLHDDGNLLVGTTGGLFLFTIATEEFLPLATDMMMSVNSMVKEGNDLLWIATEGQGIISYSFSNETATQYEFNEVGGAVSRVYLDNSNQLWALTTSVSLPLWQLNRSTDSFVPVSFQGVPLAMINTADGQLWMGVKDQGLIRYHRDGTQESVSLSGTGHAQQVNAIYEKSPSQLLLGCDDGLWLYDISRGAISLYQPLRFVNVMTLDKEGGLWVGTDFSGVSYLSPIANRFENYPVGTTARMCEDRQGRIWATREKSGLDCHPKGHPEQTVSYPGQDKLGKVNIHSLCMDGDDLWIGSFSDGVYVLSTTTGRVRHYMPTSSEQSLYDPNSCTLLRDNKGNIWVATMEGLCCYQRNSDNFKRMVHMVSLPVDIKEDHHGNLWIATQGDGVWRYNPETKMTDSFHFNTRDNSSLSHDVVNCIFIDGKNNLWIGTQGGLCRFEEGRKIFQRIQLNVPQQAISSITEYQGVLWMAGDCGVLRLNADKSIQRFTRQDGLDSEQFQASSVLNGSDGRIYFGSGSGINAFYPNQIKVNQLSAPVYITQLEIANSPVEVGNWHLPKALSEMEKLDLYYNDNVFSLTFASLSYCSPEKNMYAYKLEGFDKHWNYVGHEHKATYTNLEAGTYTFYVKATNNDGIWSDQVARLEIEVHPPFWWNIYAKIFYVIFFIFFVTAIIRVRLYITERRHRKEIARLNEIQQEEMQQARSEFFTTIAHEIRTPVSLIIGPLDLLKEGMKKTNATKSDFDTLAVIDRNAHRLLDLVNQLLDFRKVEQNYQELNFAPQNIKELMEAVVKNFETIFKLNGRQFFVDYPEEKFTAVVDREGMVKMLSNLLSNAYKYASNTIRLNCYELPEEKRFCIEVGDDGNGISQEDQKRVFDPFFQTADRKPGTGIGLSIVKKIVELHHGTVTVKSELGQGTTFVVELPIAQEYSGELAKSGSEEKGTSQQTQQEKPLATEAHKPNMLIVEDNEDMLTFLVTTFMDRYEVTAAHDGIEAVKILRESLVVRDGQTPQSTFDIVISDWMMNQMDGPELCSRMRQNTATKGIPFILLTAKTDSQSKVDAMKAGVDAFIEKPFNVKYLEACISNMLARKER